MPDPQICWINQQGHIYQQHFPGHVYRLDRPLRTRTYQNSLFWLFIDYCSWRTGWLWHFCRGLSPIRLFWLTMSQHPLHFSDYHLIWINIRGGGCFSLLHGGPVTKDLQANIFFQIMLLHRGVSVVTPQTVERRGWFMFQYKTRWWTDG